MPAETLNMCRHVRSTFATHHITRPNTVIAEDREGAKSTVHLRTELSAAYPATKRARPAILNAISFDHECKPGFRHTTFDGSTPRTTQNQKSHRAGLQGQWFSGGQ